jgi:hypothetical protein
MAAVSEKTRMSILANGHARRRLRINGVVQEDVAQTAQGDDQNSRMGW